MQKVSGCQVEFQPSVPLGFSMIEVKTSYLWMVFIRVMVVHSFCSNFFVVHATETCVWCNI